MVSNDYRPTLPEFRMRTKIKILICIVILILTGAYWYALGVFSSPQTPELETITLAETTPMPQILIPATSPEAPKKVELTATITIGGVTHTVEIPNALFNAMNSLSEQRRITFKSVLYPGLGEFINEINGIKNTSDQFWLYYVNGTLGSMGAGSYVLKDGDVIEWKFE